MRPDDRRLRRAVAESGLDHLVGNSVGKEDHQVRAADPVAERIFKLAEHLGVAAVFLTALKIFSLHTFISAYNDYAHIVYPFYTIRRKLFAALTR